MTNGSILIQVLHQIDGSVIRYPVDLEAETDRHERVDDSRALGWGCLVLTVGVFWLRGSGAQQNVGETTNGLSAPNA